MKNNKRFHDFCADALKHWHSVVFDIRFSDGKKPDQVLHCNPALQPGNYKGCRGLKYKELQQGTETISLSVIESELQD